MTKEQVIELAKQVGIEESALFGTGDIERFAKLVRNAALDEAANTCDELAELNRKAMTDSMWQQGECAAAIRNLKDKT